MTFQDALTAMQAGHRVRREVWPRVSWACLDGPDFLGYVGDNPDGMHTVMTFRSDDLLANDWELEP